MKCVNGVCMVQYVESVEEYRSMLRSVDEHSDEVRTDPLQVLHVIHNLEDILSLKPAGVGHTLNDEQLKDQVTCSNYTTLFLYVQKLHGQLIYPEMVTIFTYKPSLVKIDAYLVFCSL